MGRRSIKSVSGYVCYNKTLAAVKNVQDRLDTQWHILTDVKEVLHQVFDKMQGVNDGRRSAVQKQMAMIRSNCSGQSRKHQGHKEYELAPRY